MHGKKLQALQGSTASALHHCYCYMFQALPEHPITTRVAQQLNNPSCYHPRETVSPLPTFTIPHKKPACSLHLATAVTACGNKEAPCGAHITVLATSVVPVSALLLPVGSNKTRSTVSHQQDIGLLAQMLQQSAVPHVKRCSGGHPCVPNLCCPRTCNQGL